MVAKPLALPGDDGARLDEDERVLPARPGFREPGPERAVGWLRLRASPTVVKDRELMPQCENLEVQGGA